MSEWIPYQFKHQNGQLEEDLSFEEEVSWKENSQLVDPLHTILVADAASYHQPVIDFLVCCTHFLMFQNVPSSEISAINSDLPCLECT